MTTLTLPYPISANRYWKTFILKGRPMSGPSSEATKYKRVVAQIARAHGVRSMLPSWVALDLTLHPKEPKDAAKRIRKEGPHWHLAVDCLDVDNCIKVTVDALQGVAYENDRQVLDLHVRRGMPVINGAVVVRIVEFANAFPAAPQLALPLDDELDPFAPEEQTA